MGQDSTNTYSEMRSKLSSRAGITMKYTNNYGLPAPLVTAIQNDPYDSVGDISVTSLVAAPRRYQLEKRYDELITVDVSDCIFLLLGSAIHSILERAATDDYLVEERMLVDVNGWKISGKPDLLDSNKTLSDYKTTSVYAFMLGDKPEWEAQLNLYRFIFEQQGFEVTSAQIVAILKDFSKGRSQSDPNYPQAPALVVPIPLWPIGDTTEYVEQRVKIHQEASELDDHELPPCTDEERWCRPDWIIQKPGAKRATRRYNSEEEAKTAYYTEYDNGNYEVCKRPGKNTRCASYCRAAPFCNQWAQIQKEK